MDKSVLVVAHGMGSDTEESVKETVAKSANTALKRFKSYRNHDYEDFVDIHVIAYNDIFEKERNALESRVAEIDGYFGGKSHLVPTAARGEGFLNRSEFFKSHALDVVLYGSLHSEIVRSRFAGRIAEIDGNRSSNQKLHLVAHSLGTAALHDTLHKLFTGGMEDENGKRQTLSLKDNKLDSLWMFANVSNLMFQLNPLKINIDPFDSIVKPNVSESGCTRLMYNIWHEYDPIAIAKPFDPKKDDNWVGEQDYKRRYKKIITKTLHGTLNPHSLSNYLLNPNVAYHFLRETFPKGHFAPKKEEILSAKEIAKEKELSIESLKNKFKDIEEAKDFNQFLQRIKDFEDYVSEPIK